MLSYRLVRDGVESGIYAITNSKNQLTGNFFGFIMQSGIVLVLKWYFTVASPCPNALSAAGSTKGAPARYTSLGDDVEPRRTRLYMYYRMHSPLRFLKLEACGHKKKRYRFSH